MQYQRHASVKVRSLFGPLRGDFGINADMRREILPTFMVVPCTRTDLWPYRRILAERSHSPSQRGRFRDQPRVLAMDTAPLWLVD